MHFLKIIGERALEDRLMVCDAIAQFAQLFQLTMYQPPQLLH